MGQTAKELIREWRVRSQFSPYFCVKSVLGAPDMVPHLHGVDLNLVLGRMIAGRRHQAIEYPRGFLKTTTYTMGLSVWLVLPSNDDDRDFAVSPKGMGFDPKLWDARAAIRDQDYTQLIVFESFTNSCRKLGQIRSYFESNDVFRASFPEIAYSGREPRWNDECLIIRRKGRNKHAEEGTFEAKGVGNALQSTHFDIVWADDLVGEAALKSETIMEGTKEYYGRLVGVEQPGGRTYHFLVANRWGFNDLNSHARTEMDGKGAPFWTFYTRRSYEIDPESGERIPTWPEMYPLEVLDDKLARIGEFDFFAQYQNDPRPPGEREVEAGRIHRYRITETHEILCSCGARHHPDNLNRYLLFDPYNAKGNVRSKSCPAIVAVGLAADKHVFLLETFQKRLSQTQVAERLYRMNDRWVPSALAYEDVGAQNMWEVYLRKDQHSAEFKAQKHRPFRRIKAIGTKNKPLDIRVRDYLLPVLEARPGCGMFSVHENHQLLFDMLDTFPHSVPGHDYDVLSALAQGPLIPWLFPLSDEDEDRDANEERRLMEMVGQPYSRIGSYGTPA